MKFITIQLWLAAFTLSQALISTAGAIPSPPTVAPPPTGVTPPVPTTAPTVPHPPSAVIFRCLQAGNGYATLVSKGTKQATLITWNSNSFGAEYSPQTRCNTVTQKFQTVVNNNGGKLSNLVLTVGAVGNQTVVCAINQGRYGCNRENMLFTLSPENAKNSGAVLATMLQIGKYGSGNAVSETTELPEFNLEEVVNQKLSDSSQVISPNPAEASTPPNDSVF